MAEMRQKVEKDIETANNELENLDVSIRIAVACCLLLVTDC
jgi:hypothetical protein